MARTGRGQGTGCRMQEGVVVFVHLSCARGLPTAPKFFGFFFGGGGWIPDHQPTDQQRYGRGGAMGGGEGAGVRGFGPPSWVLPSDWDHRRVILWVCGREWRSTGVWFPPDGVHLGTPCRRVVMSDILEFEADRAVITLPTGPRPRPATPWRCWSLRPTSGHEPLERGW